MKIVERTKNALSLKEEDNIVIYCTKALIKRYNEDNLSQLGGQLAYFFILSLFPFIMAVNGILGKFNLNIQEVIVTMSHFFPEKIILILQQYLSELSSTNHAKVFVISTMLMIYMATSSVRSLLYALNHAFRRDKPVSLKQKLISFPLVLLMIFLIFISMIFSSIGESTFINILAFFGIKGNWGVIWTIIRWSVPFFGVVTVIYLLFRVITGNNFPRKYNFIGAFFSVSVWILSSLLLSYYTSNFGKYSIIYGSLGAIIIMLLFLYWSGIIIVLGGELSHILAMKSNGDFTYDIVK